MTGSTGPADKDFRSGVRLIYRKAFEAAPASVPGAPDPAAAAPVLPEDKG